RWRGMYEVTSIPLVRRTRATLRSAEFGFFGVVVYTRTHTPRFCGEDISAGAVVLRRCFSRPLFTSWLMVGIENCDILEIEVRKSSEFPEFSGVVGREHANSARVGPGELGEALAVAPGERAIVIDGALEKPQSERHFIAGELGPVVVGVAAVEHPALVVADGDDRVAARVPGERDDGEVGPKRPDAAEPHPVISLKVLGNQVETGTGNMMPAVAKLARHRRLVLRLEAVDRGAGKVGVAPRVVDIEVCGDDVADVGRLPPPRLDLGQRGVLAAPARARPHAEHPPQ